MTRAKRTVLMALYGRDFLIPEDYDDRHISWRTIRAKIEEAEAHRLQTRTSTPAFWGAWKEPNNVIPFIREAE